MANQSGIKIKIEAFVPYDVTDDKSYNDARALAQGINKAVLAADPDATHTALNASRRAPKVAAEPSPTPAATEPAPADMPDIPDQLRRKAGETAADD